MIFKALDRHKINLSSNKIILFYGKNEGYKNESITNLIKNKKQILTYDEREVFDNTNTFLENLLTKSLFENEKIIIIKRATDKLIQIIDEISLTNIEDIVIIINAGNLEKKSKLRIFFEKHKEFVVVPFYPDNEQTLSRLTFNFLKEKKISMSPANINLIINKCNGDREILFNELKKIEYFNKNGKKIDEESIAKLTNLVENYDISELIDNCLAKNTKKIINILNENNFNNEDSVLIVRTFLSKSKRILKLSEEFQNNKNMKLTISSAKPPIYWQNEEITKQQIFKWSPSNIKKLIYSLNDLELNIKKNLNNSIKLITDFILEQSYQHSNN